MPENRVWVVGCIMLHLSVKVPNLHVVVGVVGWLDAGYDIDRHHDL